MKGRTGEPDAFWEHVEQPSRGEQRRHLAERIVLVINGLSTDGADWRERSDWTPALSRSCSDPDRIAAPVLAVDFGLTPARRCPSR